LLPIIPISQTSNSFNLTKALTEVSIFVTFQLTQSLLTFVWSFRQFSEFWH
jgi:hypothetical protein